MQAYGFIETKGSLASVEALDAMLKSANVSLVTKEFVGGGIVCVVVTGDVGAVKAAVESGIASVENLDSNLILSTHVIPRPSEEIEKILLPIKEEIIVSEEILDVEEIEEMELIEEVEEVSEIEEKIEEIEEEEIQEIIHEIPTIIEMVANTINEKIENETEEKTDLVKKESNENEIAGNLGEKKKALVSKEDVDDLFKEVGFEKTIKELKKLKVADLRQLIKKYKEILKKNQKLAKANKNTLIQEFSNYYREEHK